jgi:CBS domain-containing protein/gamma-glutamylcysteine synthetase
MGEQRVSVFSGKQQMQKFVKSLLDDVTALEHMLENDWFEDDITRIGAEQELCLVDLNTYKPAPIAMEVLEKSDYPWLETELAKFNLETNLTPCVFNGDCLSKLESEIRDNLSKLKKELKDLGAGIVLTGILPTLRKFNLEMSYLTPKRRYKALMEAINAQLQGHAYELRLQGIDELLVKHDSPMLEACNTSFQVHLQVHPRDFVKMYNISQVLVSPVLAAAANSPIVFGRRLWHESRIALFQQALDTRSSNEHLRQRSPRVNYGSDWLHDSILEIYKEDIARFRVLLSADVKEDSLELIKRNKVPKLRALQVHNSTVYRWNRPCYGVSDNGKPHLRIENRVLPAGPTVVDEVANAALWLGAMKGFEKKYEDITQYLTFAEARDNFVKTARYGMDSELSWLNDRKMSVKEVLLKEVLPLAREGMEELKVDSGDIDKYLGIIEERTKAHATGARWMLRSFTDLIQEVPRDEAVSILTATMIRNQEESKPVHEWEMPNSTDLEEYRPSQMKVEEFMETDVFTVQKDDIIELVAEMLEWRKIRYLPVEDNMGKLVGLISSRLLLRHFLKQRKTRSRDVGTVNDIMIKEPITISPQSSILEAMRIMRENKIGCLPVVAGDELIGVITEMDFLRVSSRLMERLK